MRKINLIVMLLFAVVIARASVVDTITVFSQAMNKQIKTVVIMPDNYKSAKELPVVYLLHGHSDNYAGWVQKVPSVKKLADEHKFIIVCPDGGYNSWYWDAPENPAFKYETYIIKELIPYIDKNYKTIKSRSGRAVTGLSMGGHGGLYLSFRNQDIFGAGGSMSGGVDIRPFPENWEMSQKLGTYATKPDNWEKYTVINMLHLLTPRSLSIIIDCGTEDFFYNVNENLHRKLLERNIPHDYIVRPGGHGWDYWTNAIQYQLLFMSNYFKNASPK